MRTPEITSRIHRDHLRDLLDLERITAPMPAVTLTGLLAQHDDELRPPPRPLIVRFRSPGLWHLDHLPRPVLAAASVSATLLVITLLLRLL